MILRFVFISTITTVTTTIAKTTPTNLHQLMNLYTYFDSNTNISAVEFSELCSIKSKTSFASQVMNNLYNNGLYFVEELTENYSSLVNNNKIQVWLMSVLSSCAIGVSSMIPLFLISFSNKNCLVNNDSSSKTFLKYLLSFAVGGLLGDVFLHLLPEASDQILKSGLTPRSVQLYMGLWILVGILCFAFIEMIFSHINNDREDIKQTNNHLVNSCQSSSDVKNFNTIQTNGHTSNGRVGNGYDKCVEKEEINPNSAKTERRTVSTKFNITGYLNLLANGFDNLTHGMAVGASFLVSTKMGLLTTFAILVHEIPHEIGDFAILIKSGFNKWQAVRAQVSIAGVTVLGSIIILFADSADCVGVKTAWILPFTSGGFLHIALVSILPELLVEKDFYESLKQTFFTIAGVCVMAFVNLIAD